MRIDYTDMKQGAQMTQIEEHGMKSRNHRKHRMRIDYIDMKQGTQRTQKTQNESADYTEKIEY